MSRDTGAVLVGCPTFAGKEYSLEPWLAAYHALTYEPKHAYQVDNTKVSKAYFERLRKSGIDCTHLTPWPDWDRTFLRSWELMLERAKKLDCYWVFSVEADNIPAPESLQIMVDIALMGNLHLVTHCYPVHASAARASGVPEDIYFYSELGCMLMTRSLLQRAIDEFEEYGHIVSAIFGTESRYKGGYCKLMNRFTVGHLDGYEMSIPNLGASEIPGLIYPVASMPADTGTVLPPSLREEQPA